jgi:Uncharacterized conserved protein (DUF2190)
VADATFRSGDPIVVDYTPTGGNVAAGEVVLLGNTAGLTCGIARGAITNNVMGSLEVGNGVYDVVMLTNLAAWTLVYWDNANNKVVSTSTNNATFGFLVTGGSGANTTVKALHKPDAPRV